MQYHSKDMMILDHLNNETNKCWSSLIWPISGCHIVRTTNTVVKSTLPERLKCLYWPWQWVCESHQPWNSPLRCRACAVTGCGAKNRPLSQIWSDFPLFSCLFPSLTLRPANIIKPECSHLLYIWYWLQTAKQEVQAYFIVNVLHGYIFFKLYFRLLSWLKKVLNGEKSEIIMKLSSQAVGKFYI